MCAADHSRPSSHRTVQTTSAVFFWLSYAHGLGRVALYLVCVRTVYVANKIGGLCMQCIMQPTSSIGSSGVYTRMIRWRGPQISKCGPSDVSFRTEQSYVLEATTRAAAAVDHTTVRNTCAD